MNKQCKANIQEKLKRGAILYTLSHELTHVSENATEEYIELRKAVQQVIGNQDWNGLVEKHSEILRKTKPDKYNSMTELERSEYASQEALAEACSDMLKGSDILLKMAEDNPTVTKKLINFFKNVIEKIRKLLAKNSEVQAQEAHLLEEAADDLQSIVDKWEKAVIAGIKNQNAKMQSNEQKNNTADNSDVKNQARNTKPDYKFKKALDNREWGSFYASVTGSNQRDSFRIGNNGVLIPDENYPHNYKLVYYEGDSTNPCVTAVYKLLNYDYTIHDKKADVTKIIIRLEGEGYNDKHIRTILQNYTSLYGPLFERYNRKSGKYIKLTRKSVPNRGNVEVKSDRTGISENAGQGISDNEVADNIKYQSRTSDLDNKYLNAVNSGDIETAQKLVDESAKENGYTIKAFHGTARSDRVGNVFLPERATSGPMAFFTDSKEIASNYARDKQDTSLAYDEEYSDYYTQFRTVKNGKSIPVSELWKTLSYSKRQEIKEKAKHITFDDDYENIIYDENTQYGLGDMDPYTINRHNGNVIDALIDSWLESGNLYDNEERFLDVLKKVGLYNVEYRNPNARYEKVYAVYLNIRNAFDTSKNYNQDFVDNITFWAENNDTSKYQQETANADMWDKNNKSIEDWIEKAQEDVYSGTANAWTSIPDAVTAYLKSQGYDGIKDTGGKGGGNKHNVYIPFSSEQIKSADPVTYDDNGNVIPLSERFNAEKSDIRYQARNNSYQNIDLSTLDDSELRVYNKRGWANELFTKEDRVLLNEKFNELNPKVRQKTDNVLGDGSKIVEVNNKIVLIGGTFEDPIVHNVLVINTDNEIEAEIFKEWFIYDTKYRKNKTDYIGDCEAYESIVGEGLVRNYNSESFNYYKGRKDSGERAVLPNSFKSYGYTKQFQDRAGTDTETERGISNEVNSEKYQSRTSDLDNKYLNAVENNDLNTAQSIVDKWEKAVIAGIKNQNAKMQSNEQKNNTADNSDVKNSIRNTKDITWDEQINNYFLKNGLIKHSDTLVVEKNTPDYLTSYMDNLPMALPIRIISKAQSKKDISHSVNDSSIKRIQSGIRNSIATIYNKDRNSLLFITDIKQEEYPLVVAFEINSVFDGDSVHKCTSIHLRTNIEAYLSNLNDTTVFVKNKNELNAFCREVNILDRLQRYNKLINVNLSQNNNNVKYQSRTYALDNKYLNAVENNDLDTAQKLVDEAAKENGYTIKAFHGTARSDRVGNVFLPERATSGPMAFFTDSEEIAQNYARDKQDTSLAYDDEYTDYYTQFRVERNGKSIPVSELWKTLSYSQKQELKEKAKHITFDDDYENIIYDNNVEYGIGAFDEYALHQHNGNVIDTLIENWLDDGNLIDEEERFLDVLKLLGIDDVEYRNPNARSEKVYSVYLNIRNAFDTSKSYNQDFVDNITFWAENNDTSKYQQETANADMWDKNNISIEDWIEKAQEDVYSGTAYAWTTIPDAVTAYLKSRGYDGIKDTGGKGGGNKHNVYIPFSSEQIKSSDPITYDDNGNVIPLSERFNAEKSDIRYQARNNSYQNIDLSTLDDSELRVYNKRGWANELFTKEDRVLLNEKFNELNPKVRQKTDNVLGDGSRIVEVNNKIVLIGGTFDEPIIHSVFVINADNETEANIYKEIILNEYDKYKQGEYQFANCCELFESVLGNKNVRNYKSTDFRHYKGRKDSGERAVLPNSFKSYGYTKQFQNRAGADTETERGISNEVNSEKYQSRTSDLDNKYLNALENNDLNTAQSIVDKCEKAVVLKPTVKKVSFVQIKKELRIYLRGQGTNYPDNLSTRVPILLYEN